MIDRIFAPLLTFVVLLIGSVGLMSALLTQPAAPADMAQNATELPILMLEPVLIIGKREQAASAATVMPQDQRAQAGQAGQAPEGRGVLLRQAND